MNECNKLLFKGEVYMDYICYDRCFIRVPNHEGQEVFIPLLLRGIPNINMREMHSFYRVRKQSHKEWVLANGETGRFWFTEAELETLYSNSSFYDSGLINKDGTLLSRDDFSKWMLKGLTNRAFTCGEYLFMKNKIGVIYNTSEASKTSNGVLSEEDIFKYLNIAITNNYKKVIVSFKLPDVKYPDKKQVENDGNSYFIIKTTNSFFAKFSKNRMYGSHEFTQARVFQTEDKALDYIEKNEYKFGQFGYEVRKVVMDNNNKPKLI